MRYYQRSQFNVQFLFRRSRENKEDKNRTKKIMGLSGLLSAFFTIPAKAAFKPGGDALLKQIPLTDTLNLSIDPILYGIGIIVGPRIGISMLIGGLLQTFVPP